VKQRLSEEAFSAALSRARTEVPGLEIAPQAFEAFLLDRLPAADPNSGLQRLEVADLYLSLGCLQGLPAAHQVLERRLMPKVEAAVRRVDPREPFVRDILQSLRERILVGPKPKLADYAGTGALLGWLRAAAIRMCLNERRGHKASGIHEDELLLRTPDGSADPEMQFIQRRYRADFERAFSRAMASLDARERAVLRFHFVEGLSIDGIAALHRVHRATAARRVARAREKLLSETRRRLAESLRLSTPSLDSLLGALRSHLDLSVRRFLQEGT
jgi:RNA polymerase sigma-70 factor, ECF subfamily